MRFLKLNDSGQLILVERSRDSIPEYAILSHTWGPDGEEVTYEDLLQGTGRNKPGYKKLDFCAKQAEKDGLTYFWIDTCCINKANFTELSEAINSMFDFYRKAARCYVYLSDVPDPNDPASTVELAFPSSRWFKRGWTLQELIAPQLVQFFSWTGDQLGTKASRVQQVHEITGIATEALQGCSLSQFDVSERLSWAAERQTTVEEDAAYCLLGICGIHMPLIYGEGRQNALERLQREVSLYLQPPPAVPRTGHWIVPFQRNPRFTGRKLELTRLEEMLLGKHRTSKLAVTGLGGVGKTQLVLELLYRIAENQRLCSIIWISAVSMESLHQSYLDTARQLGIPGLDDAEVDAKRLVQEFLAKDDAGQWLLVFDNADDIEMWMEDLGPGHSTEQPGRRLIDHIPRSKHGSVMFTTRDRKTAAKLAPQNVVELSEMSEAMAMDLLRNCLPNLNFAEQQQDAISLVTELTFLPLAIVQATAYIFENGITLADYLSLLLEQEEEVVDLLSEEFEDGSRYRSVKNPVATTWLISFAQIQRRDSLAAEYLSFMSCIEPKDIPQSLLPPGPSRKAEIDAIGTLNAYSFVSRRPAGLTFDLHRLVHLATRNWLRKEGQFSQSIQKAIMRLNEIFPGDSHENRSLRRTYLPHVRCVLESDVIDDDWRSRVVLLATYGSCLCEDGRWDEAEKTYVQEIEILKEKLGADHRDTLVGISNLAVTYSYQGRQDKAEKLKVQVMEIRKEKLGADHPHTLSSMSNLAVTYRQQGRLDEAEKLGMQVIKIRKEKLGADHPDTLTSMANLAIAYYEQGRLDEVEKLELQVMETRKEKLGGDHPGTLTSMANLATTYSEQGRLDEAEKLDMQAMEIRREKLGADHPDTLNSMANMAARYHRQGRLDEAEKLELQVMEIRKEKFGASHPDTLTTMNNLSHTWKAMGRQTEAVKLLDECVQLRKQVLGASHPKFLSSSATLSAWRLQDGG
jgi:tetratricopeptide (TPR) repeat protein